MPELDNTYPTSDELLKHPYDPAVTRLQPPTGVLPFDYPRTDLSLNNAYWGYLVGMLDRLTYTDAWDDNTAQKRAGWVAQMIEIIDAIGAFKTTRADWCNQWLSLHAVPTSLWSIVTYGTYYSPTNIYFGTYASGTKTIQIQADINLPLTHIGLNVDSFTDILTIPRGFIRFFADNVQIYEASQVNGSDVAHNHYFGGSPTDQRPTFVGTLRIIAWINDDTPADPNNYIFLTNLTLEGWGTPPEPDNLCT